MKHLSAVLLAILLVGCATTAPSTTGTVRQPDVIYSNPGQK